MPYNTRRKSLSLPSLGIQLPNSSRAHRSASKSSSPDELSEHPPAKRVKREHDGRPLLSPPRNSTPIGVHGTKLQRRAPAHTPPPSPGDVGYVRKVDTDGINDDVVVDVIEQLEKTGNRPHLIKELATVLASINDNIAHSANPAALLSSRINPYMKRPWTALSPCPLAKGLLPVHPRKTYIYLTTQPQGPLPETSDDIIPTPIEPAKRLTPSVTDPSVEEDTDMDRFERDRMSPSPEVELFSPELDQGTPTPQTPGDGFSGRSSLNPDGTTEFRHRPHRAPSPGLEADERGFTETASAVRASRMLWSVQPSIEIASHPADDPSDVKSRRDHDLGYELFGRHHSSLQVNDPKMIISSPMLHPKESGMHLNISAVDVVDADIMDAWHVRNPEDIDVEELDAMFDGF